MTNAQMEIMWLRLMQFDTHFLWMCIIALCLLVCGCLFCRISLCASMRVLVRACMCVSVSLSVFLSHVLVRTNAQVQSLGL